jgi:DNA adenine methylase Dam
MQIKGPFSYSGNKYKIWKNYLKEIMSRFDNIHEPFLGSGVCLYNANVGGIGIDIDQNVISLHNSLYNPNLLFLIEETYEKYFKGVRNEKSYYELRNDFNKSFLVNGTTQDNVHLLHLLIQLSFNSLIRFSKKGYNVPFGRKKIDFERIKLHQNLVKEKKFTFLYGKYDDLDFCKVDKEKDLIYIDPPYIASKFQYGGWCTEDETILLKYIDKLNSNGFKFILSNTFSHRNIINKSLIDWSMKYEVKNIKTSYNSWTSSVSSVKYESETSEVLISNFIF